MYKRVLIAAATASVAAVVVGLSTAATTSPNQRDSTPQPKGAQTTTSVKKSTKPASSPGGVVSSPEISAETSRDAARYWTPERMRDAKPLEKTVTGGSGSSSRPSVTTVRASEPSRVVPAQRQAEKKTSAKSASAAAQAGGVTSGPATSDPGYWTPDRMGDAQPPDMTVPGDGDTTGGSSDPGVGVIPASTP